MFSVNGKTLLEDDLGRFETIRKAVHITCKTKRKANVNP